MCDDSYAATGFGSAAEALRMAEAAMDHLNSAATAGLSGGECGEALIALGRIQAKQSAARAGLLHRFDAAGAHDADGYGSASAWLAANGQLTKKDARAAVREMRRQVERPRLHDALSAGQITQSWADEIAAWTGKLPAGLRDQTDQILLDAAAAGASLDDLATIADFAIESWRRQQPDADDPDPDDRSLRLGTTLGGAGVIRGDLTPECATALRAVLEALGKKHGPEDDRSEPQRFHDALQLACTLLLRGRLVPDRAGADTQAVVHIPLSQLRQLPGADDLEDDWLRDRLGQAGPDGQLTGQGAEAAACDAQTVPVVTGTMDPDVIDQLISLARTAAEAEAEAATEAADAGAAGRPGDRARSQSLSPQAWRALRYAMARLAVDLVSGPHGIAAALRRGLLQAPYSTPSLPLDIGYSHTIPGHIRRAVTLRDKHCAWPGCDRPPVYCDVHHLRHQADGGETSVTNCALVCQFHHDVCIHRRGWQLTLHPDGTTEARSPDGKRVLRSHAPPTSRAG